MARLVADRNLLLGILALQNGFIDRDTLVDALQAWVLDQDVSLGRLLRDRGSLDPQEELLLEALASTHLRRNGDDPERSLADLRLQGSVREILGRIGDSEPADGPGCNATRVRGESLETRLAGPGPSVGRPSASGLRFHIVRPHARGGLGEVFLATDAELNRTVALKRLREQHADNPRTRARFLVEAEITGRLEHPGIVPVYGLGTYADGRPFYAMRFIRGVSLKDAIRRFHEVNREPGRDPAQRSLELRQLLGRFIDVCDAMEYAHSRGVLHRDLKPDNILLGKYGETLVVDWGLAKALGQLGTNPSSGADDDEALRLSSGGHLIETVVGSILGTPGFMSPEQATGDLSRLGPAIDVYSLGATLYCLLTGQAPFRGTDASRLLVSVGRGEFPPPRAINAEVPAPLEAICLKAMALAPGERYPTPRLLAQDIERWLADEPISARREPRKERIRRWARRHRSLVTGAAAAGIVALLALGGILAREAESNRRLRIANARESRARDQAQARFRLARDAVAGYYRGVSEEVLLKRTEFRDLRRSLLKSAMDFYKDLAAVLETDQEFEPSALLDLARADKVLARITREIASSGEALKAARRAQVHFARLVREQPGDPSFRRELAGTLTQIAFLQEDLGHPEEALQALQDALAVRQQLVQTQGATPEDRDALAGTYGNIGNLLDDTGRQSEALRSYRSALDLYEPLIADQPGTLAFERELARVQSNLALLLARIGRRDEALRICEGSHAIRKRLADTHPGDEDLQGDLAGSFRNLGSLQSGSGRPAEALESFLRSASINKKLVAAHPNSTKLRRYLANNYNDIGGVHGYANRMDEALRAYQWAREIQQVLVVTNPEDLQYPNDLATSLANIAIINRAIGRLDEVLPLYEQSLALRRKLSAANPADTNARSKLAWTHYSIGVLYAQTGRQALALTPLEQARQLQQSLADAHPDLNEHRAELARTLLALGLASLDLGRSAEATGWLEQARNALATLARREPTITAHRRDLARTWIATGQVHRRAGRHAEALRPQEQARTLLQVLVRDDLEDCESRSLLGQSWTESGSVLARLGRYKQAVGAYREAVSHNRAAFDRAPQVVQFREELSNAHASLSECLLALRRPDEAAASALVIRELWPRDGRRLFEAARLMASCAPVVGTHDAGEPRPGDVEPAGPLPYLDAAIETLRRAVAAGFRDARLLAEDAALASLRLRPDFQAIAMDLAFPADPFR
jgi:serine/threonine-protein kinase